MIVCGLNNKIISKQLALTLRTQITQLSLTKIDSVSSNRQTKPRAKKQGLIVQDLPDETLVYDLERDLAHCLNETASLVWRRCDGRTTTKEIALSLAKSLKQPVDEKLVWLALDQLDRNHLLSEESFIPQTVAGMNRREVVRALGVAAAVAIPAVVSIVAPLPAQAATGCQHAGGPCANALDCCNPGCTCTGNTCVGTC